MLTKKTTWVEFPVAVGNTNARLTFTDQAYLRGVQILSVETFAVVDIPVSPAGNALVTLPNLSGSFVTFYTNDPDRTQIDANGTVISKDSGEYIDRFPMIRLRNMDTNASGAAYAHNPVIFNGQTIYWDKSFITMPNGGLGNGTVVSFAFLVTFQGKAIS